MAIKQYLQIKETPDPQASILVPDKVPLFRGQQDTNLACGNCKIVLAAGVDAPTLRKRVGAPVELLVKCPACGKHNLLPFTLAEKKD